MSPCAKTSTLILKTKLLPNSLKSKNTVLKRAPEQKKYYFSCTSSYIVKSNNWTKKKYLNKKDNSCIKRINWNKILIEAKTVLGKLLIVVFFRSQINNYVLGYKFKIRIK